MFLEQAGLAAALIAALANSGVFWRTLPQPPFLQPVFRSAERAVDNWRSQGAFNLDIAFEQSAALLLGRDIRGVSRCVRLNNYWCVKKAGWTGEIASDAEGHVAFASAADGAGVAAALLRRYYVDLKLHSARAIVERWAPAQCGPSLAYAPRPAKRIAATGARSGAPMGKRRLLGPEPKGLTTHGLGNTLRAKYLARRGGAKLRPSRTADRTPAMMQTPTIAAGFSAGTAGPPVRLAMLPFPGVALGPDPALKIAPSLPPLPAATCASETRRIGNYAASIADGVAAGPDDDLALFNADGRPTPNFARALANMAAVEIGPLRARQELVDRAVARLARK